jgi:hypothetical protein
MRTLCGYPPSWKDAIVNGCIRLRATLASVLFVALASAPHAAQADWPQFDGNAQHSGNNTQENVITAATVNILHRFLHVRLPSVADGAPVYLSGVSTVHGIQDLVFLTTRDGHVEALNAQTGVVYDAATNRIYL